jgi:hypothetical protein
MHAYGRYAYRMVSVRSTPMRDTPMRWPSMRDTPMGMVYWRCMSIKVFNYSGRDTSFGSDNMIFVGENWLNKIDRIPKDRMLSL